MIMHVIIAGWWLIVASAVLGLIILFFIFPILFYIVCTCAIGATIVRFTN